MPHLYTPQLTKIFQKSVVYSYVLLALCQTLFTLYLCYAIEWRGPFRDLWEFVGNIRDQLNGHWDVNTLVEPYGGIHRILIPKLLFYADYRFAHGSNLLALSVTLLLHSAAGVLFIRSITTGANLNRTPVLVLVSTILLFFFSTTQIYNLIYISDNQVVISNTLAIFCAWFFCLYLYQQKRIYLYIAIFFTVLACLSHSSSLMMWPAMIIILFLRQKSKKEIAGFILLATFTLVFYLSGHDPLDHSDHSMSLWQKVASTVYAVCINSAGILRYIGMHLSSPTSREHMNIGIVIAYLSIAYLFFTGYRVYTQRWRLNFSETFWLTLACYGFFIAVITAYGRQIYPNSALTDRYQTLVMTYWAALMLLLYVDLKQHQPALSFFSPVISLALLLPYQYQNAEDMAWLSSRVTIAHTAATVGITDIDTVAATLSHPLLMDKKNLVAQYNDFLRSKQLAYFSETSAHYFLQENTRAPFTDDINPDNHCNGKLLALEKSHDAYFKFTAQAYADDKSSIEYMLVLDKEQKVIGLANNHRSKGEFLPLALRDQKTQQWIGFAHTDNENIYPLSFIGKNKNGYCTLFTEATF